jgi:hypothetical protein
MFSKRWPEEQMEEDLQGRSGQGTFEAHITVEASDLSQRQLFQQTCARLGVKSVLIELPQGQTRSQPMTSSYHRGELGQAVAEVASLAASLRDQGFPITRVKFEAVITNDGVPQTDEETQGLPPSNYFEFHVKVTLPAGSDLHPLEELCQRYDAHLSGNAFRQLSDGQTERFVTMRLYGVGKERASRRFENLRSQLIEAGYALSNTLREYALFDSNLALDAGWIEVPGADGRAQA